jgi:hypothetical protein
MSEKPSVDELRARLRELGYLDAGVDRFVLGPVRGGRSLRSAAWRSSVRIGLLAALLLGPSMAVALGARFPALVTGVRDAFVLALYLGILFGAAVGAIALAAAWILGSVASRQGHTESRRARVLSLVGAGLVAGACLVYLVFWWRTVSPEGPASYRSAWTWVVLAIAAAISLLLGHTVRVTTLALTVRGAGGTSLHRPLRSRLLTLAAGALAFGAACLLFVAAPPGEAGGGRAPAPSDLRAEPTGVRLTVLAIDGLDTALLERLVTAGQTPVFARLLSGARADLPAADAPDPARAWTSLATGQPAVVHGVTGIEARRVSGIQGTVPAEAFGLGAMIATATDALRLTRPALTSSVQRRSKTFWEVAADAGVPSLVVNWWATWPVPDGAGTVLSDRATLRLDRGGPLDAEIAPAALYERLRAQWPAWRAEAARAVGAAFPDRNDPLEDVLRRAAEQDVQPAWLTERAPAGEPRLRAVYLPGLDIAQYELLSRGSGLPPSAIAARVEALERYYVFLDGLVSGLLTGTGAGDLVALVGDPGRSTSRGRALLALSGPVARAGQQTRAERLDVVPTLLYALGVPVSRKLPGRIHVELFDTAFIDRAPRRQVDAYGPRTLAPRAPGATPLDQEMLDRLRSLGYVR